VIIVHTAVILDSGASSQRITL